MNSESLYVDANNSDDNIARFFDMSTVSASPNSYYVQTPMQNNLRPSTYYDSSNLQHVYVNSHTSTAPEVHMPMNNVMSSVNKYETPNVINFIACKIMIHPFIHMQKTCNILVHLRICRWTEKLAMILLVV
jgi:hypothetical protein